MTGLAPKKTIPQIRVEMIKEGDKRQKGENREITETKGDDKDHSLALSFLTIPPWPPGKKYLGANVKNLSREFEEAFKNARYHCGYTSHKAQDCRIYPNSTIISLCTICRNGLHDMCKSYKFKIKGPQDSAVSTVKKLENIRVGHPFFSKERSVL